VILPPALREFVIGDRPVAVGDLIFALRRTLLPFGHGEFIPKVRPRLARAMGQFYDQWGVARLHIQWLPLSEGEEEVVYRDERDWAAPTLDKCSWPDPVTALALA